MSSDASYIEWKAASNISKSSEMRLPWQKPSIPPLDKWQALERELDRMIEQLRKVSDDKEDTDERPD